MTSRGGRRGGSRDLLLVTMGQRVGGDKCRFGKAAMQSPQQPDREPKKRPHSQRVEPDDRTEALIQWQQIGTREESAPSAGWAGAEGGGFGADPVSHDPNPREEERGGSTSTGGIWRRAPAPARSWRTCQPCVPCRERAAILTEKNKPRSGGERGSGAWVECPRRTVGRKGRRNDQRPGIEMGVAARSGNRRCNQGWHAPRA